MPPRIDARSGVCWMETAPGVILPAVGADLSGWDVQKKRSSHWNARREAAGRTWFLKWFFHGRWRNPARSEFRAAVRVAALGVPTVLAPGWGRHARGTFIVIQGSTGFPADEWRAANLASEAIRSHTGRLAEAVARLHDAGLCHRDLNVYHVLVDGPALRIIDLGRVRRFVLRRWIVKDLASLLESAVREGLPPRWARLFFRRYLAASRRQWKRRALLGRVIRKAERYRAHNDKRAASR